MNIIPFHTLPQIEEKKDIPFIGQEIKFDKRSILVAYTPEGGDRYIQIRNQIDDETTSELEFGLTKEAAGHLLTLLHITEAHEANEQSKP